ncbi:MAG: hypothetical protein MRJ92_14215 [Nitrospira sp.]|nr:hypothetical protein [Nitrospira sp.]
MRREPVINKQGVGFKGMIPAVFARKSGERFFRKTGIRVKLTSLDADIREIAPMTLKPSVEALCRRAIPRGSRTARRRCSTVGRCCL